MKTKFAAASPRLYPAFSMKDSLPVSRAIRCHWVGCHREHIANAGANCELPLPLPDADERGQLPDFHGDCLGRSSRAEFMACNNKELDLSLLTPPGLANRGVAVSVSIRQLSVFIRVRLLIFRCCTK